MAGTEDVIQPQGPSDTFSAGGTGGTSNTPATTPPTHPSNTGEPSTSISTPTQSKRHHPGTDEDECSPQKRCRGRSRKHLFLGVFEEVVAGSLGSLDSQAG